MQVHYLVSITAPHTHLVQVTLKAQRDSEQQRLQVFLPSWSPGSYLMREYARHIRTLSASTLDNIPLSCQQIAKGTWEIDWTNSPVATQAILDFQIVYEVYCHEFSVRTCHVDSTHAFLHAPAYLLGIKDVALCNPIIRLQFPEEWQNVTTGLEALSKYPHCYIATDYDQLLDCPIEIGNHETDTFYVNNKAHHIGFYGDIFPHVYDLRQDIQSLVELISHTMNSMPYTHYAFIAHFIPRLYGGIEHSNSAALQFDGRKLANRKEYIRWLGLVAHEYFHTWNIKRIRPTELAQFDYCQENYTRMLWLAEGLTSFMDDLFVLRAGLCTIEEYLEKIREDFARYYATEGRRFHSLEDSSFNAWIKLYRPDENTANSSISYYLKGGLVFALLHIQLLAFGKKIDDLLHLLWQAYQENPSTGVSLSDILAMITQLSNANLAAQFHHWITNTDEINFADFYQKIGIQFVWKPESTVWLGIEFEPRVDKIIIKSLRLDAPAYQSGLNAGDEIIAVNHQRVTLEDMQKLDILIPYQNYQFLIARSERVLDIDVNTGVKPDTLDKLLIIDRDKALAALL
ncbi:M61 family metallopeptidase [Beggiatoa leptomitoformis]|uniref:PDZ domain-containing protein n=1 Tax=Beggiatoa leptomitoformis TaxID=288004 RepID=A0A2N9YCH2_9GAMM|nr:PDZ domain-containing protein [Beggiatoa leptomitoformis]ALG66549.1 PDZ domain-containing protein [Beggiatoa leptomitoformis]AUI68152.1 PDZ domain-containing protein [Beggiatoa leptomitoformis]